MESSKIMYALEYKSYDGSYAFDIFKSFNGAKKHALKINSLGFLYKSLFIFKAEFNPIRIYIENNEWNYDDCMDTLNYRTIEIVKHL